jgi:hypothetical protein
MQLRPRCSSMVRLCRSHLLQELHSIDLQLPCHLHAEGPPYPRAVITETNRIRLILLGMPYLTFGSYLVIINRILIPPVCPSDPRCTG